MTLRLRHVLATFGVLGMLGALTAAAACGSPYGDARPATDTANDGEPPKGDVGAPVDPCRHAEAPSRPGNDDDPTTKLSTITMAVERFVMGEKDGVFTGVDVDGVCTCDSRPGTAYDGGESCRSPNSPNSPNSRCDGDGGLDNAFGQLADSFKSYFDFSEYYNSAIAHGRGNFILQVADYNGRLNDAQVNVALVMSDGIVEPTCPTSKREPPDETYSPGWCGDDLWTINPDSVLSIDVPSVVLSGWVTNGVLVARAPTGVAVPLGDFGNGYGSVILYGAVLFGTMVPLGEDLAPRDPARTPTEREKQLYRLDNATLAGRITARDLLGALGRFHVTLDGGSTPYLCESPTFDSVRQFICGATDLNHLAENDHNPTSVCDALSIGWWFSSAPAVMSGVSTRPHPVTVCDPKPDGTSEAGASFLCP